MKTNNTNYTIEVDENKCNDFCINDLVYAAVPELSYEDIHEAVLDARLFYYSKYSRGHEFVTKELLTKNISLKRCNEFNYSKNKEYNDFINVTVNLV